MTGLVYLSILLFVGLRPTNSLGLDPLFTQLEKTREELLRHEDGGPHSL